MYVTHGKTLPAVSFPLMVIWMTYESFLINEDTAFFLNLLVQLCWFFLTSHFVQGSKPHYLTLSPASPFGFCLSCWLFYFWFFFGGSESICRSWERSSLLVSVYLFCEVSNISIQVLLTFHHRPKTHLCLYKNSVLNIRLDSWCVFKPKY